MSKDKDTVAEMLAWAVAAESVYPLAMALRRYADDMKRLQAELAAAKDRIEELDPLSPALELEEALRHMKQEGGGA